jgi:hypothetical protein
MSDQPSSERQEFHTVILEMEIDGTPYQTMTVTDDVSVWFAQAMGQAVSLTILEHFGPKESDESE